MPRTQNTFIESDLFERTIHFIDSTESSCFKTVCIYLDKNWVFPQTYLVTLAGGSISHCT
jgi:hypothetical protein